MKARTTLDQQHNLSFDALILLALSLSLSHGFSFFDICCLYLFVSFANEKKNINPWQKEKLTERRWKETETEQDYMRFACNLRMFLWMMVVDAIRFKLTGMKTGLIWHRRLVVLTILLPKDTTNDDALSLCYIG